MSYKSLFTKKLSPFRRFTVVMLIAMMGQAQSGYAMADTGTEDGSAGAAAPVASIEGADGVEGADMLRAATGENFPGYDKTIPGSDGDTGVQAAILELAGIEGADGVPQADMATKLQTAAKALREVRDAATAAMYETHGLVSWSTERTPKENGDVQEVAKEKPQAPTTTAATALTEAQEALSTAEGELTGLKLETLYDFFFADFAKLTPEQLKQWGVAFIQAGKLSTEEGAAPTFQDAMDYVRLMAWDMAYNRLKEDWVSYLKITKTDTGVSRGYADALYQRDVYRRVMRFLPNILHFIIGNTCQGDLTATLHGQQTMQSIIDMQNPAANAKHPVLEAIGECVLANIDDVSKAPEIYTKDSLPTSITKLDGIENTLNKYIAPFFPKDYTPAGDGKDWASFLTPTNLPADNQDSLRAHQALLAVLLQGHAAASWEFLSSQITFPTYDNSVVSAALVDLAIDFTDLLSAGATATPQTNRYAEEYSIVAATLLAANPFDRYVLNDYTHKSSVPLSVTQPGTYTKEEREEAWKEVCKMTATELEDFFYTGLFTEDGKTKWEQMVAKKDSPIYKKWSVAFIPYNIEGADNAGKWEEELTKDYAGTEATLGKDATTAISAIKKLRRDVFMQSLDYLKRIVASYGIVDKPARFTFQDDAYRQFMGPDRTPLEASQEEFGLWRPLEHFYVGLLEKGNLTEPHIFWGYDAKTPATKGNTVLTTIGNALKDGVDSISSIADLWVDSKANTFFGWAADAAPTEALVAPAEAPGLKEEGTNPWGAYALAAQTADNPDLIGIKILQKCLELKLGAVNWLWDGADGAEENLNTGFQLKPLTKIPEMAKLYNTADGKVKTHYRQPATLLMSALQMEQGLDILLVKPT